MVTKISSLSAKSCFIEMRYQEQILAVGTGFLAKNTNKYVLVTARHNLTGRHSDTGECLSRTGGIPDNLVCHTFDESMELIVLKISLYNDNKPRWREHLKYGSQMDVAAIDLTSLDKDIFYYKTSEYLNFKLEDRMRLNDGDLPLMFRVADTVSIIGFPFGVKIAGMLPVWATGYIASEPNVDHDKLPLIIVDCRARQGQSGSPVVVVKNSGFVTLKTEPQSSALFDAPCSSLIGIYTGRINAESDLGRVWKKSAIHELVLDEYSVGRHV